ncbi:uncharacterized protein LOC143064860 [Mytilus galloprovincialis]|uniref:uncharacterized protein LOC143064860 n=1 Tax=Mytilus galloprovincialis TaxID=29158 RepID=UPI003F7C7A75
MHDFCQLIRLIAEDKFPLHNISFRLLLEVVRWYSVDNTSKMFYSESTLKFWKVMYRLFHGKVLRFMAGIKSVGQVVNIPSSKGEYDPQDTQINFAVPSTASISKFDMTETKIPRELPPGIINQAIELKSSNQTAYVLSVDGKKVATGLNATNGDQDLFGYEDGVTLKDSLERIERELSLIETTIAEWNEIQKDEKIRKIETIIKIVSFRLKDLRKLLVSQQLALRKFRQEAGDNWRSSRFVYAISSVQASIYQLKAIVKRLLDANNCLLKEGSNLVDSCGVFVVGNELDVYAQNNMVTLKEPEDLPEQFTDDIRYIKQRTEKWFTKRKNFKLTGSKLYEGLGLDTLKGLQKHFDKVVRNIEIDEEISDEVRKRMEHGTQSEIHAVATLTGKVLPFFSPGLKYIEEGAHVISVEAEPFILVSPDGSVGHINMESGGSPFVPNPLYGCEFKCPSAADFKTPVHYEIPIRYIPQVLSEMVCLKTDKLWYLCWTEESSTIIRNVSHKDHKEICIPGTLTDECRR